MSMLAERRRKTKWVINPTKKPLWTTESNGLKFGKELMEKMGWSAGKGLGAKEQGIQEPLKVSYKNDTKGMGFKGNDDDWIEQQDEFNVLLNQLRSSDDSSVVKVSEEEKNEIKSLEEKSKQSRARVHYQKFTRGKDLSRYSENDLACILGTNKIKKEKSKAEEVVESEEKNEGGLVTSFGVTTINSGSIQDYFKKKWITDKVQSKNVEKEKEEHSCDERPSFSRVFEESEELFKKEHRKEDGSEMNGDSGENYEKRKKRKKKDVQASEEEEPESKRRKTSDQDNPVDEELQDISVAGDEVETENLLGCENNCDSRKRKKEKRKSKKGIEGSEEAEGLEVKKKRKKERKEKPVENGNCDTEELASINCSLEAECPERKGEMYKRKKKGKTGNEVFGEAEKENVDEQSLGVSVGEMNDAVEGDDVAVAKEKKKRKYKDHGGNLGVDDPSEKNELGKVSHVCEDDTEVGSKKKKKKKEKQYERVEWCGNENGTSCEIRVEKFESGSNSNSITGMEVKKKKKKKEESEGDKVEFHSNESGPSNYEKCDGENCSNSTVELEEVKKKKKKKEKVEGGKVECSNNGNEISNEIQMDKCDNGKNSKNTTELEEVKKKKKKKEKQEDKAEYNNNGSEIQVQKCDDEGSSNGIPESKRKKKKREKQEDKLECFGGLSSEIQAENCDNGSNSNIITDSQVKKKKKKREKLEEGKVECSNNGSEISNEIQMDKCDYGSSPNSTSEVEEFMKKKKKKEKQEDKVECCSGLSSEIPVGNCHNGNNCNSTTEVEEIKKKKKKKEKQEEGKVECNNNGNEISKEIQMEKCDNGSNSKSTTELEEIKKKKKKKEKQEDKIECNDNGNEISSEVPLEKSEGGNNFINTPELEAVKKKKKKDKHKTKEEDSKGNKESCLDKAHQESILSETVEKKKKKEKKEKEKSADEGLNKEVEEESKESSPDKQSTKGEVGSDGKREERKCGSEGGKEEGGGQEVKGKEGNAEIGTTAGIDKVELISQRAAYEHVAGQHRYERVKKMIEFVNLTQFRGSNLECLDGYGNSLRKCQPSVR